MFYFFPRHAEPGKPGGINVSKHEKLPDGDFRITEYCWGHQSLWFVGLDRFTGNERQAALNQYRKKLARAI